MTSTVIPLDVVSEIISWFPVLYLPNEWQCQIARPSTHYPHSTHAVALVCRSWLPIAMNHLFRVCSINLGEPQTRNTRTVQRVLRLIEHYQVRPSMIQWGIWENNKPRSEPMLLNFNYDACARLAELSAQYGIVHEMYISACTPMSIQMLLNVLERVPTLRPLFGRTTWRLEPEKDYDSIELTWYDRVMRALADVMINLGNIHTVCLRHIHNSDLYVLDFGQGNAWAQLIQAISIPVLRNKIVRLRLDDLSLPYARYVCMLVAAFPCLRDLELENICADNGHERRTDSDSDLLAYGPAPALTRFQLFGRHTHRRPVSALCCWFTLTIAPGSAGLLEAAVLGREESLEYQMLEHCGSQTLNKLSVRLERSHADLSKFVALKSLNTYAELVEHRVQEYRLSSTMFTVHTLHSVQTEHLTQLSVTLVEPPSDAWALLRDVLRRPHFQKLVSLRITVRVRSSDQSRDHKDKMRIFDDLTVNHSLRISSV